MPCPRTTRSSAGPDRRALVAKLKASGPLAIFDPHNLLAAFDAFFPLDRVEIAGLFVQDVSHIGRKFRDFTARPITQVADAKAGTMLIAGFDAATAIT